MFKKTRTRLSIRLRITLIVSLLLALITLVFAGFSISSSRRHFAPVPLSESLVANYEPFLVQEIGKAIRADKLTVADELTSEMQHFLSAETNMQAITATAVVMQSAQESFGAEQILALCLINLLGIALTYLILGRALRPLTVLSREIESIHEHNLNKPLPLLETQDELGSLTRSFNAMLSRLRQSFEIQKNFAANAAHELKTPLTIMKSSLQLLELDDAPSTKDYREATSVCAETVEQMIALVSDLLRISSSQTEERTSLDLPILLEQACALQEEAISAQGLQLTVESPALTLETNPTLLGCILDNLLSNAVKYNKPGGEISLMACQEGETLFLTVSDTGIGIPEESLAYIFESFYRVDPSRSKQIAGNGLGLPIVKAAIAHLGGQISVESRLGEGTQFSLRLPLRRP